MLALLVISIIGLLAGNAMEMILQLVVFVVIVVPSLALGWRRLHDAGFAGPWYLLGLIPLIGWIAVIVMTVMPPSREAQGRMGRPALPPSSRSPGNST